MRMVNIVELLLAEFVQRLMFCLVFELGSVLGRWEIVELEISHMDDIIWEMFSSVYLLLFNMYLF